MTSISRLTVITRHPISISSLLHPQFAFEPKKFFVYNKTRLITDPNEPKEPNKKHSHRLASFRQSPTRIGVPSQIPSISSPITAMQPCVQSPSRKPWTIISPPGSTQATGRGALIL
jgi:hypothetical protein